MASGKIYVALSQEGQRRSLLSGGDGRAEQTLTIQRDSPLWSRLVAVGIIGQDGTVVLSILRSVRTWDIPPSAEDVVSWEEAQLAAVAENSRAATEKLREETLTVLRERRTKEESSSANVDRDGLPVDSWGFGRQEYTYPVPDWPYGAPTDITECADALVWIAELATERDRLYAIALEQARVQAREKIEAERVAKEKRAAALAACHERIRAAGGDPDTDTLLSCEDGALTAVPPDCWESHNRGKNWLALISPNPRSPGGLDRTFLEKARGGSSYYLLSGLSLGDAVEFGADYYSGRGRKNPHRWYGFIVGLTPTYLLLRAASTGKAACKAATEYRATLPVTQASTVEDQIDAGIARVNGEGAIVPVREGECTECDAHGTVGEDCPQCGGEGNFV